MTSLKISPLHKWLVLFATGIMIMLVNIDMTIVNLALAKISDYFNLSINEAQWVIGSYLLGTALSFIIFGQLADHYGRKRIFLLGTILFTTASLIAGLAEKISVLILFRFIQGLGCAATLGLAIVLIVNSFPETQKGYATGLAITISGLSQAIGPTLGGGLLQHMNWHWIFLINVPLSLLSFAMAYCVVPKDQNKGSKSVSINLYNTILFMSGLGIVLCALNQINVLGYKILIAAFVSGAVLLWLFIKDCQINPKPLIDLNLLTNRGYLYIILLRFIFMIMMCSLLMLVPLYLQNILNFNPLTSGIMLLSMTLFVAVISQITGRFLDKVSFIFPLIFSFVFALATTLSMLNFNEHTSYINMCISLILFGFAVGFHTPSSINGALLQVSKEKSGTAIGLFFTSAMIGATIGVALSGALVSIVSSKSLLSALEKLSYHFPQNIVAKLLHAASGIENIHNIKLLSSQVPALQVATQNAFLNAFGIELEILSAFLIIAVFVSFKLKALLSSDVLYRDINLKASKKLSLLNTNEI